MQTKRIIALIILAFLIGLIAGIQWQRWRYASNCEQLGGAVSHDAHPVCRLDNDGTLNSGNNDSSSATNSNGQ